MTEPTSSDVTQLLLDWCEGDTQALDALIPLVYDELHRQAERFMRRERQGHTLQPTALVHEAFLQLVDQDRIRWQNRAQFFGVAAQLMRRIVLKHARHRSRQKRGGGLRPVPLEEASATVAVDAEELLALDQALDRLAAIDARQGRILELRHFGGLTVEETAACLGVSTATVKREARLARAWMQRELAAGRPGASS